MPFLRRPGPTADAESKLPRRQSMLDAYPSLQERYKADDGNTAVFYLKDATASAFSQTGAPEVLKF